MAVIGSAQVRLQLQLNDQTGFLYCADEGATLSEHSEEGFSLSLKFGGMF